MDEMETDLSKSDLPKRSMKNVVSIFRSSAAEYLTFVAATGQGGVETIYADETVWLTQKMLGLLYDVDIRTINYHLKKIFTDKELDAGSVVRIFRITASDGKSYNTQHYTWRPSSPWATRSTQSVRCSSANGPSVSSSRLPSKALRLTMTTP